MSELALVARNLLELVLSTGLRADLVCFLLGLGDYPVRLDGRGGNRRIGGLLGESQHARGRVHAVLGAPTARAGVLPPANSHAGYSAPRRRLREELEGFGEHAYLQGTIVTD
jgi:hypothetical protein